MFQKINVSVQSDINLWFLTDVTALSGGDSEE